MSPRPRKPVDAAVEATGAVAARRRRTKHALTQRQLVDRLFKIVGPSRPARSSVKLSRGPRGQVMPEVLVHAGDEPGLTTVEAVEAKAREVFDRLCEAYPLAGFSPAAGDAGNGD